MFIKQKVLILPLLLFSTAICFVAQLSLAATTLPPPSGSDSILSATAPTSRLQCPKMIFNGTTITLGTQYTNINFGGAVCLGPASSPAQAMYSVAGGVGGDMAPACSDPYPYMSQVEEIWAIVIPFGGGAGVRWYCCSTQAPVVSLSAGLTDWNDQAANGCY